MTSAGHRVDAPTHEPAYRGTTWAVRLIGPSVGPLTPQFQDRLSEPPCSRLTQAQAEHDRHEPMRKARQPPVWSMR